MPFSRASPREDAALSAVPSGLSETKLISAPEAWLVPRPVRGDEMPPWIWAGNILPLRSHAQLRLVAGTDLGFVQFAGRCMSLRSRRGRRTCILHAVPWMYG